MAFRVINVADLRRQARARLPKMVFDYLDGGAEDELTLAENRRAFRDVWFRPRNAVAVAQCDLRTRVLGTELALPVLLAPVGYSRLMHADGELAAARAAGKAGTAYILSTISGYTLKDVKAATCGPAWYQLYLLGGRAAAEGAIERAHRAGFSALMVTIDTPVAGARERDVRNGAKELLEGSLFDKLPFLPQIVARPRWLLSFLWRGRTTRLENVVVPGQGAMKLIHVGQALAESAVTWDDFRWIRELWRGPIVVKGVLTADDARRAVDAGAAAVVVSNHGGRQLDSACATLRVLPEVSAAVGRQAEVLMDSGIRRGSDVVKALCLGARAVLIGRAYAYGLAAAGEAGVTQALNIFRDDLERTLRLLGCPNMAQLDASYVTCAREGLNQRGIESSGD